MSERPIRLMVDANVWVDGYCAHHNSFDDVDSFMRVADTSDVELLYPVHVIKDVLYIIVQEYKRQARKDGDKLTESSVLAMQETALACMRNMAEMATAVGADGSDVWLADKYLPVHPDFEDNLVLAACQRARADYLVTSDLKLIEHADVLAKTPAQMTKMLRAGVARRQSDEFPPSKLAMKFGS